MSHGESRPSNETLLCRFLEQATHHALMLLDTQGRVIHWVAASESLFGYTAEEILGQSFARLFIPDDRALGVPEHELRVAQENGSAQDDRWMARKDGSRFWADGVLVSIQGEDREPLAFGKVLMDRTDLKTQTETLHNRIGALNDENERRSTFLSVFAHEVRNNLVPLKIVVELIRSNAQLPESLMSYLEQAEGQIDTTQRLITDFLDASRIGKGKFRLQKEAISLREALDQVVDAYRLVATERQQTLRLLFPAATVILEGDAGRLHQVFANLLDNAVKYTPVGGAIWVKVYVEGEHAVVNVEDSGVGISPELSPQIFELFSQSSFAGEGRREGLGIGLWLVKSLVEMHGGTVAVRSPGPGKGSKFTVRLPLKELRPSASQPSPPEVPG